MVSLADFGPEVRAEVKQVREVVAALHQQLIKWNLVVWTAGNVSQRLHSADLMVIKPSGLRYEYLTPSSMVVCDLDGNVLAQALGAGEVVVHGVVAQALVEHQLGHGGGARGAGVVRREGLFYVRGPDEARGHDGLVLRQSRHLRHRLGYVRGQLRVQREAQLGYDVPPDAYAQPYELVPRLVAHHALRGRGLRILSRHLSLLLASAP